MFDAKEYGPEAIQNDEGVNKGSEDCLTINIQRPAEGENLPVFVYIHGGGYTTGAANVPLYNGKHFADDGLVFVSFQYRMSVLGFYDFTTYPGGEEFESNCGISDQILAMRWIHENISAFGGDRGNVTINGESAGGASVVNLLAIPAVKGYFQKAIAQSSLPNCLCTHQMARQNIDLYLEGMGMSEKDIPKLKEMDPFDLLKGVAYVSEIHQYKNPGIFLPGPVLDDLQADATWKCHIDRNVTFYREEERFAPLYIHEKASGNRELFGWKDPGYDDSQWSPAIPYRKQDVPEAVSPGNLKPRTIPYLYRKRRCFQDVMALKQTEFSAENWRAFLKGERELVIPAHTESIIELDAGEEILSMDTCRAMRTLISCQALKQRSSMKFTNRSGFGRSVLFVCAL